MPVWTIPPLAFKQHTAAQQLDELLEICRPHDFEHVEPLQVKRKSFDDAWSTWQYECQTGREPDNTPSVPNLTRTECEIVDALYRSQLH